jgi:hypothetical protein
MSERKIQNVLCTRMVCTYPSRGRRTTHVIIWYTRKQVDMDTRLSRQQVTHIACLNNLIGPNQREKKGCRRPTVMLVWRKELLHLFGYCHKLCRFRTTRSITPAPSSLVNDENQSMSSGDESDDEDLTDADSSGSEWSGLTNGKN